jgi:thiol-disulfide isomerase/thioredoxin
MARALFFAFLLITAAVRHVHTRAGDPTAAPVHLETVKYDGLIQAVRAQRGKVVVVDVWADFCVPCKREFPHLVRLHNDYGKDGLVCMSVSVDDAKHRDAALKFLTRLKATFPNYWLDEDPKLWQERWNISGPPLVFVFDRRGRRAAKFDNEQGRTFTYEDVKKVVGPLLREAP